MKFLIQVDLGNDGMKKDPGYVVTVQNVEELMRHVPDELCNDNGQPFGPGVTLTIERIA